jgi:hypothetical protein
MPSSANDPRDEREAESVPERVPTKTPGLLFALPKKEALTKRLTDVLDAIKATAIFDDSKPRDRFLVAFRSLVDLVMRTADRGRVFTDHLQLDNDIADLTPALLELGNEFDAQTIFERARQARQLAWSVNFRSANATEFRAARQAWLLSCFWNSALIELWATNRPNAILDFIGYLVSTQAEIRYNDAQLLLLLRVSFSITRIGADEDLIPEQFLDSESDLLGGWLRYTIGLIFVRTGPGRVAPSRVTFDSRVPQDDGMRHAAILMSLWKSQNERAAAAVLLLEMGAWLQSRAARLVRLALQDDPNAIEVWTARIDQLALATRRVRVVRPNPWEPGCAKPLTVQHEAIALLAADVREHNYEALDGDLTLQGQYFHRRRVPTFVCSADFGPLGLFKLDAADRVDREKQSFDRFAQRLHPRFRASRCDTSIAVVTEPDDGRQFVKGLLTSYVFTEDETPRSLNDWLREHAPTTVGHVLTTLFMSALQPWYRNAVPGVVDLLDEFPIFQLDAISKLTNDLSRFHDISVSSTDGTEVTAGAKSVDWLLRLRAATTKKDNFGAYESFASDIQACRSYRSVVHGDLHLDNILVIGRTGSEYPCVIDFEATHEGYILKDFGRFVAASITRLFNWNEAETAWLLENAKRMALGQTTSSDPSDVSENTAKLAIGIAAIRQGIVAAWRSGTSPSDIEWCVTMAASLLPYARYPDTPRTNALLALKLSDQFVEQLSLPAGA